MRSSKNFVGRQKELKTALRILRSGKSLIVEGPYGIGKTALAKRIASEFGDPALYSSFEDNASDIVDDLNRQLIKYYRPVNQRLGSQIRKFLKATEERKPLIIIDDIWKVTLKKIRFFKRLNENQNCQFILISEVRNSEALLLIKGIAWNNETLRLGRLSKEESILLFEKSATFRGKDIKSLIESCRGYPLGIIETAKLV